jgi:hypothetical protein
MEDEITPSYVWAIRFIAALAAIIGVFFVLKDYKQQLENEHSGKTRKVWSGISYRDRTVIVKTPLRSAAAAGFASERVWSGEDDWEPAIAVDPSSQYVYQMTTRYSGPKPCNNCRLPAIVFRSSSDGGATWSGDSFLPITRHTQNDPQMEVATDGTIYAVFLDDYNPGIKFTKSTNRGATWSEPFRLTGGGRKPNWSDKPVLAISPDGQHVYIAFNASDSYVVASHNFGQSFESAVKTNNDQRYWFHSAGAVAPNGDVYFAAADFSQTYTGDSNINILRSTNQGSSWSTQRLDTSAEMPPCDWADGCYLGFLGPSIGVAINGTGSMVIAYNAGINAGEAQKLWVRTSSNGVNWSERQQVSQSSNSINNAFPAVAAGTNDFRLVWQDDSNAITTAWNTWLSTSQNGGQSWSTAVRLSDLSSGAPYKTAQGYRFPYGDYLEIAVSSSGTNHIIWGEGDSYTGPGGSWYTSGN